jgi:RNA polymerase sigma-70 factor (ECF subfamily)
MRIGEKRLLERIRAGDRQACTALIDAHYQPVYWYLLDLSRDEQWAADLTQDTFARMWTSLDQFRGESSFRTWLFSIARNEFLQGLRQSQRSPKLAEYLDLELVPDSAPSVEEECSRQDLEQQVRDQVARLPGKYRDTIALHYFAGMSLRDTAQVTGVPRGTAKSRLNQALAMLSKAINAKEACDEDRGFAGHTALQAF